MKIKILNNGLKPQVFLCSRKKRLSLLAGNKPMVDQEQSDKEHLVYRHNLFVGLTYPVGQSSTVWALEFLKGWFTP